MESSYDARLQQVSVHVIHDHSSTKSLLATDPYRIFYDHVLRLSFDALSALFGVIWSGAQSVRVLRRSMAT